MPRTRLACCSDAIGADKIFGYGGNDVLPGNGPFDGYATTGIVLEGLTSLDDFDYWYIV